VTRTDSRQSAPHISLHDTPLYRCVHSRSVDPIRDTHPSIDVFDRLASTGQQSEDGDLLSGTRGYQPRSRRYTVN